MDNTDSVIAYVKAAARAIGMPMDDERAAAVAQHYARTLGIAQVLDQAALAPGDEPAEGFLPAPFPPEDPNT